MTKQYSYLVYYERFTEELVSVYGSYEDLVEGLPHNHATLAGEYLEGDGYDNDGVFKWGWKLDNVDNPEFKDSLSFPMVEGRSVGSWSHKGYDHIEYTTLRIERWETNWYEVHYFEK